MMLLSIVHTSITSVYLKPQHEKKERQNLQFYLYATPGLRAGQKLKVNGVWL